MAVQIKFDSANMPEQPTIVLAKRNKIRLGVLNNITNFRFRDNLTTGSEISFQVNKFCNGKIANLWHKLKDFKYIEIPEWNKWFQIQVEINEDNKCIKNVTGRSACEAELSTIYLYDFEANSEKDIKRKDYAKTVLYDPVNPKKSLLNRMIADKATHYIIKHVDSSITNIQRTFSFNGRSLYDCFQEVAEEIHCLFVFGEYDHERHTFRTISVYDLENHCESCNHRGDFVDKCPKCGEKSIISGYGNDTTIFISKENLGEDINYSTNVDKVKNCFRLEAGDDLMTTAVMNASPSGSQYIWYHTEEAKEDMSTGLVEKLNDYKKEYDYYNDQYVMPLNATLITQYNTLINKYKVYDNDLETLPSSIVGYNALIKAYYDAIDFSGYLEHSLMPAGKTSTTSAKEQAALLTVSNLSPCSVMNDEYISQATADSALLNYARVYIDTARYRIKIKNSSFKDKIWTGVFTLTNYYDGEDTADTTNLRIVFNGNYENFVKQKLEKALAKENKENLSITALFKKQDSEFKNELKKYSLSYLKIFYDACQACIDIMIEQGVSNKDSWNDSSDPNLNLYEKLYKPYVRRLEYISQEIIVRENEIKIISASYDKDGKIIQDGLKTSIAKIKEKITKMLDFKTYLGEFWDEFSAFRMEDDWKNDNYISDGLKNSEIFEKAKDFVEAANKELIKSATLQHTISANLKNLLLIPAFKPLVKYFEIGNWLRIEIDEKVYKLRLVDYAISFDGLENIDVEFSDVTEALGVASDIKSILQSSKSMSSSYNSVKRQASKGNEASSSLTNWMQNGLNATKVNVVDGADQNVVYDKHGLLIRQWDDITGSYLPSQTKFTNATMAYTNDNWVTAKAAIGEFEYYDPKDQLYKTGYGVIADTIVGSLILGEQVGIYNKSGGLTFDDDGLAVSNGTNSVLINPNATQLFKITSRLGDIFFVDDEGNLNITGKLTAQPDSGLGYWTTTPTSLYRTTNKFADPSGKYIGQDGFSIYNKFTVDNNGNVDIKGNLLTSGQLSLANGKIIYKDNVLKINEAIMDFTGSTLGYWTVNSTSIYNTSSTFGEINGKYFGADGLSISNKFKVDGTGKLYAETGEYKGVLTNVSGTFSNLSCGKTIYNPAWISVDANANGACRIGVPNYSGWKDVTIHPDAYNRGYIGTPLHRWNTIYANIIAQDDVRENKELIEPYTDTTAWDILKSMPLYTYSYKNDNSKFKSKSLGTMLENLPEEILISSQEGKNAYNLGSLCFWMIGIMQNMQKKIETLEQKPTV